MTLPFLKAPLTTTHCLIGVGSVGGLSAVSYGGYYIHDSSTLSYGKKLSRKGYTWDVDSFQPSSLNVEQTKIEETDKWKLNRLGCFNKFFPGAAATHETAENSSSSSFSNPVSITDYGTGTDSIGCMLARLNYRAENKFTYKSEITVRNGKFGWAIWTHNHRDGEPTANTVAPSTGGTPGATQYDWTLWTYHILFLEKNNDDKWEVKGGYYLADNRYYSYKGWVSITPPGQKRWLWDNPKSTSYSGIWIPNSNGKEVFEDIKFEYGGNTNSWLGRSRGNANLFDESGSVRFFKLNGFYDVNNSKWITDPNKGETLTGLSGLIEPLYAPFKGKKGKWYSTSRYCSYLSSKKTLSSKDAKRLEDICFRQS